MKPATLFGHRKTMKEWVALPPPHEGWRGGIAAEARDFVAGTIAG
jgi:hypothetical protein